MGYKLTRLFEQAFSTPKLTEEGFGSSLALLLHSRQATFGRANAIGGSDLEKTVVEYVKDCTLSGVDLGFVRENDLWNGADTLAALRFDSRFYGTLTFLPGDPATGAELDCTDAWNRLVQHINSGEFRAAWEAHLTGLYGENPFTRAQDALDALVGVGHDARTVMLNNVLAGLYLQGIRAKHIFRGDVASALVSESAIAQRNVQWAAERTLFMRVVRPMLAAIEGLMYAVTPLLAFLIALNGYGLGLVGQYLMMTLWIQLWLPVMAIINLYINMIALHDMEALATIQGIDPISTAGLAQMQLQFADWLGTGSMLAASVPAITLFLVYGGAVTATNLAGRMQSGDFITEKTVAPDPIGAAPLAQLESGYTHNPTQGLFQTGAPGALLPTFDRDQVASASIAPHEQEVQQASRQWFDTLSQGAQRSVASGSSAFDGQTLGRSLGASHSAVDQYIYGAAQEAVRQSNVENVSAEQLAGAVALSGGKGISGTLESRYGINRQDAEAVQDAFRRQVGGDEMFQARLSRELQQDAKQGVQSEFSRSLSSTDQAQLQRQESNLLSKGRELESALEASRSWRVHTAIGTEALGQRIAANPELLRALKIGVGERLLDQAVARHAGPYGVFGQTLPDHDQAYAAAAMSVLLGYADPGRELTSREQDGMRDFGMRLWEQTTGAAPLAIGRPEDQAVATGIAFGPVQNRVEAANLADPRPAVAALPGQADSALANQQQVLAGAPAAIQQFDQAGRNRVQELRTGRADELSAASAQQLRERLAQAATENRSPARLTVEELAGGVVTRLRDGLGALDGVAKAGVAGFQQGFQQARQNGAGIQDAFQQGLQGVQGGYEQVVQGYYTSQLEHARSLGLSDKQAALYAQSSLSVLAGLEHELPVIGTAVRQTVTALGLSPDPGPARQAVLDELQGDPAASHVTTLIERAGRTFNDTDLRAIGQFDRARSGNTEFWDRAPQPAANGRPLAGVIPNQPAPSHLATYEAAANRLMGRLVIAESSGQHTNPGGSLLTNPKSGAQGITQLMPATAQNPGYGVTPVRNQSREEYLRFGRDYLAAMLNEFDGDPRKALAAYNWGSDNVENAVQQYGVKWEVALQQETRDYLRKILG